MTMYLRIERRNRFHLDETLLTPKCYTEQNSVLFSTRVSQDSTGCLGISFSDSDLAPFCISNHIFFEHSNHKFLVSSFEVK